MNRENLIVSFCAFVLLPVSLLAGYGVAHLQIQEERQAAERYRQDSSEAITHLLDYSGRERARGQWSGYLLGFIHSAQIRAGTRTGFLLSSEEVVAALGGQQEKAEPVPAAGLRRGNHSGKGRVQSVDASGKPIEPTNMEQTELERPE